MRFRLFFVESKTIHGKNFFYSQKEFLELRILGIFQNSPPETLKPEKLGELEVEKSSGDQKIIQRIWYFIHHLRQEFGHYSNVKQNGAPSTVTPVAFVDSQVPENPLGR